MFHVPICRATRLAGPGAVREGAGVAIGTYLRLSSLDSMSRIWQFDDGLDTLLENNWEFNFAHDRIIILIFGSEDANMRAQAGFSCIWR